MRFGLLFRPQDPPAAANISRRWQEILRASELAEEVGFDGLFVPEHHMMPDGYLPAPLVGCAAIAARTRRVDVGTTVFLLPFYNPVQVAEQAAMVDVISGGRMILGVGIGNFEPEFALYGLDKRKQGSRFEEGIDLVQRAWAGEDLDHRGRHFTAKGRISPLPSNPRLWIGAMSEVGVRRAARFGCPWPTDPLHNLDVMRHWTECYRAAGEEFGTSDKLSVALLRDGWVADDLDAVERDWWPSIRAEHWFYFSQVPRWVADREPLLQGVSGEEDFHFQNHHQDRLVVGSPAECLATIRRFEAELANDYLIMSFRVAAGPSHEKELECIERFGREVIAAYRAQPAAAARA
jgi:alkanesulfonate monooxygenase SsuD/methylene tetrahydromethanopterin reductase-like flavin-dependent oxidoreductase (luciferase family)